MSHGILFHCASIRFGLGLISIRRQHPTFKSHTVISISIHRLMFRSGCTPYWFVPPLRFRSCRGICSLNALTEHLADAHQYCYTPIFRRHTNSFTNIELLNEELEIAYTVMYTRCTDDFIHLIDVFLRWYGV